MYAKGKLYLMLNDGNCIQDLTTKLEQYGISVSECFKTMAIMAVEYDAAKYPDFSKLETLLLGIEFGNQKAIKGIENVPVIKTPEKPAHQTLKVTYLDDKPKE